MGGQNSSTSGGGGNANLYALLGAGAQTAGAVVGGRSITVPPPKPLFPSLQSSYLSQLGGMGSDSFNTMGEMIRTGAPTDVGPAFEAFKASQKGFINEGRANLQNTFGEMGLYDSSSHLQAQTNYEGQVSKDFATLLQQWSMGAAENAANRRAGAATAGLGLFSDPALAMFQGTVAGSGGASAGLQAGGQALQNIALLKLLFPGKS